MHRDLLTLDAELSNALAGLDVYQSQATPTGQPTRWSIQQIVEHLVRTYRSSVPAIQARIAKGTATRTEPTFRQRIHQFVVIGLRYLPFGRNAPAAVSPGPSTVPLDGANLAQTIHAELASLDEATDAGQRIFGSQRAVPHTILGPLSMEQWRRFHLIHGRHHIKQILAIRRDHSF